MQCGNKEEQKSYDRRHMHRMGRHTTVERDARPARPLVMRLADFWKRCSYRVVFYVIVLLLLLQYCVNISGYLTLHNEKRKRGKLLSNFKLQGRNYSFKIKRIQTILKLPQRTLTPLPNVLTSSSSDISTPFVALINTENINAKNNTSNKINSDINNGNDDDSNDNSNDNSNQLPTLKTTGLPLCPRFPPNLIGNLKVLKTPLYHGSLGMRLVEAKHATDMKEGGFYKPPNCVSRSKVALVIPHRDRDEHLQIFLNHLVPILKRQQLEFAIYVVDQKVGSKFNRAMLMNVGFVESRKDKDWDCFVFHDVDLLPENDHNIYSCPKSPRHMSAAVDKLNYQLPYKTIFGGVSALTKEQFLAVNGYSNMFFGWGAEDDDMYRRIAVKGYRLSRYPMSVARYTMLTHNHDVHEEAHDRFKWLNGNGGVARMARDGVSTLKYNLLRTERHQLFTKLVVEIDQEVVRGSLDRRGLGFVADSRYRLELARARARVQLGPTWPGLGVGMVTRLKRQIEEASVRKKMRRRHVEFGFARETL